MKKSEFKRKINILLDIAQKRGYITYEEIDKIFPKNIGIEDFEEIFYTLQSKGIRVGEGNKEVLKVKKDYTQKLGQFVDNYIDTPEKFYFAELYRCKKFDKEREIFYSKKFTYIKKEIKNLIINTNYFVSKLLKDFYKIKIKKMSLDEIFNDTTNINKTDFINIQNKIKKLYKQKIMIEYNLNQQEKELELSKQMQKIKKEIFDEINKIDIKFKYIMKCINEANKKKEEFENLKWDYEQIKLEHNLTDKEFNNLVNDIITLNLPISASVEKKIYNFLQKEKKINGWFSAHKISYDEIKGILNKVNKLNKEYEYIKELIINSRLPIVISIAKYYSYRGLSFQDLIQEGNVALLEAIDRYEFDTCGKEFSAYVSWWIRKKMYDAIMKSNENLKIPKILKNDIKNFLKAVHKLRGSLLRTPTDKEIAGELGWSIEKVKEILKYLKKPLSLDVSTGNENTTLKDYVQDPTGLTPIEIAINNIVKEKVKEIISKLSEIEQKVIKMRFGIEDYGNEVFYYEKIAEILKIPVNSVKEIEKRALRKLKYFGKKINLDDFLD